MSLQRKLLVIALASVMPMASVYAQSAADLQKDIAALKAQLQALQQKVDALTVPQPEAAELTQLAKKLELRADQADDTSMKSGFKDLVVKGTIQAVYQTDDLSKIHSFRSSDGNDVTAGKANHLVGVGGIGMLEITKHHEGGDAIDWTLRLTPSSWSGNVHEASVSIPVGADNVNRVIGGLIPDWTGSENVWANLNPLITHSALYDYLSATSYQGIGMSHQLMSSGGQTLALKWLVGNIDSDNGFDSKTNAAGDVMRSYGLAYRLDWTLSEYASVGLAGNVGNGNRNWQIHEVDGTYARGNWTYNGMFTIGVLNQAGTPDMNGAPRDTQWVGISGQAAYKVTPRLQMIARADYIDNHTNGGGTYAGGSPGGGGFYTGLTASGFGVTASGDGALLSRVSLGTSYQINPNAQWKLEYRNDHTNALSGFQDSDGNPQTQKNTLATAVVWAF